MEPFILRLGVEVPHDVIFVTVHHSVKILPDREFMDCRSLKEVTLREGLEEIGACAFCNCRSLERINFPSTLIKIIHGAFMNCHSLKEIQLLEGLKEIRHSAFHSCVSLERINYPSTLIKIDNSAFYRCHSLKELDLPEGLKEIGRSVFEDCVVLERINFPFTLIKIGHRAFSDCRSLKEVNLPERLEEIGDGAFQNCRLLDGITIPPKAFILEIESFSEYDEYDHVSYWEVITCRLVLTDDGTFTLTRAKQMIISPEHLNYIRSSDLLEIENVINTIMNDRGHTREENIERVLALIKYHALFEVSTILELTLWKNEMNAMDDSNLATRADCRVMCGGDDIIPGVLSYL